jgi:hypothetical protein
MFTISFTNRKLLATEDLRKGQKHNLDFFISDIRPELEHDKMRYQRIVHDGTFSLRLDYSKSQDGGKIQGKFDIKGLVRSPHPPYSPDLSPCDFCFFGMTKEKMKDREFHTVPVIRGRLTEIWKGLTFEDVQSVFLERKILLNWVVGNGREYYSE